jgi:hypothetical protein
MSFVKKKTPLKESVTKESFGETEPVKLNPGDAAMLKGQPVEVMSVSGTTVTVRNQTGEVSSVPSNQLSTKKTENAKDKKASTDEVVNQRSSQVRSRDLEMSDDLDPLSAQLVAMARARYPSARSDLGAIVKLVQRSILHGEEADRDHDRRLKSMERRIVDLERELADIRRSSADTKLR